MGTVFAAQYTNAAGAGSWQTGEAAFLCAVIAVLALLRGERKVTRADWAAFIGSLSALPLLVVTKNPLSSVIMLTMIDAIGFYPTLRNSYQGLSLSFRVYQIW